MYIEIDFSLLGVEKGPITLPEGTSIQDAIDTAVYYNMPFLLSVMTVMKIYEMLSLIIKVVFS